MNDPDGVQYKARVAAQEKRIQIVARQIHPDAVVSYNGTSYQVAWTEGLGVMVANWYDGGIHGGVPLPLSIAEITYLWGID